MTTGPAETVRQASAEFYARAENHRLRRTERRQLGALYRLFGQIADDMEVLRATEKEGIVSDWSGQVHAAWGLALGAAHAWLVRTPEVPE